MLTLRVACLTCEELEFHGVTFLVNVTNIYSYMVRLSTINLHHDQQGTQKNDR